MKKVLFQGAFDLFHHGHLVAIKKAKTLGDYLIIALNTDKLYRDYKQKEPIIPYKFRKTVLEELRSVDQVVPATDFSPLALLKKFKIDVYVITREWENTKKQEMDYMKRVGGKTIVLPYFKGISSTEIKDKLFQNLIKHNKKLCPECHRKM